MFAKIALIAYLIDKIKGEFKSFKHPVILMGDFILFFEKRFYKDSKIRGFFLFSSLISISFILALLIEKMASLFPFYLNILILGVLSSIFLAHKMLRESVIEVLESENKREKLSYIVSRDTKDLNESEIYKACIETYAENLNDALIAPLFYLLLFGFKGIVVYKAVNTLDSMVGYKTKKYNNFGFFSAKVDDIAGFIPARITAFLILLIAKKIYLYKKCVSFAKKHESPNAGYPISAMALILNLSLGGDTKYFGKIKKKAKFGDGREIIYKNDVLKAISFGYNFDKFILTGVGIGCMF